MSLLKDAMSGSTALKKISVNDIRCNSENLYHIDNISELATLIEKNGVNSGVAYYEEGNDGKHYTLLGGESRYHALSSLLEAGRGDGLFPLIIRPKPRFDWEEKLLIIQDNFQREKSHDDKKREVEQLAGIYEQLKKEKNSPIQKGTLKREWISSQSSIGVTTVQKFLTGEYSGKGKTEKISKKHKIALTEKEQKEQLFFGSLKNSMEHKLGTKVVFAKGKFSISFANIKDLNRILETLDLKNIVNDPRFL